MVAYYQEKDGSWKDIETLTTKSEDRIAIDEELDKLEEDGHYGKIEITSQNGRLIYVRSWTKPLSGANKKKKS